MDLSPPGSSAHGIFQARVTGVGCHCLLWWLSWLESKLEAKWLYLPYSFLNELNWKGQCVLEILLDDEMICNGGGAHTSSSLGCVNRLEAGCMLGKLFCVLHNWSSLQPGSWGDIPWSGRTPHPPSSPAFFFFFPLYYILGHSMALHWPERQRVLSYSGFSHGRCAGPLLGLAVALSLAPPPVSLFILCNSNCVIFRILLPYLQINSHKRKVQFLLMKNAKKSRA